MKFISLFWAVALIALFSSLSPAQNVTTRDWSAYGCGTLHISIHDSLHVYGKAQFDDSVNFTGATPVFAQSSVTGKFVVGDSLRVGNQTTLNGKLVVKDSLRVGSFVTGNSKFRGHDAFTTSATLDTVVIAGLLSTDFAVVCPDRQAAPGTAEFLSCHAGANGDTLFVSRNTGTTSALAYTYILMH